MGFAPSDNPQIAIATPIAFGYGSGNACDFADTVMKYYFQEASEEELLNGRLRMWALLRADSRTKNVWRNTMLKQYKLKDYRFRLVAFVVALTVIGILIVGSTQESLQSRQAMGMFAGCL